MKPAARQLRIEVIDAMTTNETLWFRDGYPFTLLQEQLLPQYTRLGRPLKIWSAACSSGQEPYSLAMSVIEYQQKTLNGLSFNCDILATDLSPTMLERSKLGMYDSLALGRGLSENRKRVFFEPVTEKAERAMAGANGFHSRALSGQMIIKDHVKRMVNFRPHNLLDNYSLLGKFDIIFCRNVLIYFSPESKQKILRQFAAALNPKGILFLGASESISGLSEEFNMVRCHPGIYYQKRF